MSDADPEKRGEAASGFVDRFGSLAPAYATYRPRYPAALFDWLATAAPGRRLAWDCAAGSGQATLDVADHFRQVVATDASAAQLAEMPSHPRVVTRVALAGASGLADASVDLVTVAQALHWLDLPRFYAEVRRVLAPGGLLAAWCYAAMTVEDESSSGGPHALVQRFYSEVVGPYWPAERRLVEQGYRGLPFPFPELEAPPFVMETRWTLDELAGYLRSWSATARYVAARNDDPVTGLLEELAPRWGGFERRRRVSWALALRVGRRSGEAAAGALVPQEE